jgi:hypothetical protein
MAFREPRVLTPDVNVVDQAALRLFIRQLAGHFDDPPADVRFKPETTTASPRSIEIQVQDRLGNAWKGRWLILVVVGTAAYAGSAGTHTITASDGLILETLTSGALLCLTDADGLLTLDVAATGPTTRHIMASIVGRAQATTMSIT